MAIKPMKTLKLPGLDDTYTFLQNDTTLAVSGKAADAKSTGDALAAVQAQVDGVQAGQYPDMGAGQLLSTTGTVNSTPYTYRANTSGSDRVTISQITGGTVAFNQLVSFSAGTSTSKGITATANADGTVSFSGTATDNYTFYAITPRRENIYNHVIMLWGCPSGGSTTGYRLQDGYSPSSSMDTGSRKLYKTTSASGYSNAQVSIASGTTVENVVFKPQYFDLTQMFGSAVADYIYGLETATAGAGVALFRQMFPESYYPYNAGELVSVQTSGRKTVGFNLWDGTYEAGKRLSNDDLGNLEGGSQGAGYNVTSYIRVFPGAKYYHPITGSNRYLFYDSAKAPVPGSNTGITSSNAGAFYAPKSAAYVRFTVTDANLSQFILNLSDTTRNGTYEPYNGHTYPLDSTLTLRGVPVLSGGVPAYDGDQYTPDGTVTRRYGVRAYASGDESDATVITDGTNTVYPLSAQTTETAAPYQSIQIAGSTEEFLPPATDTRAAAVPVGSMSLYQTNLREGLETLLDTDLAHAESIAPVQGSTASANIASGELLMRDGKLYTATQAIVAGAEIGSTNTIETTLAAKLAALEARIAALEN